MPNEPDIRATAERLRELHRNFVQGTDGHAGYEEFALDVAHALPALLAALDEALKDRERLLPMPRPLGGRPGLIEESAAKNALAKDLGQLARRHGLCGCVLISFTDERVGVNSSGQSDDFGRVMEVLGDRLLAAIDDGKFDPDNTE